MNYYPHHIGDFNSATRNLSWIQKWAYRELLELYYDQEKPIANDLDMIFFKLGAQEYDQQQAIELVLKHFFEADGNVFVNKRCDDEICHYQKKQTAASNAGKASAAARMSTAVKQPLNSRQLTSNHNHNQEPITKKRFKKPLIEDCVLHINDKVNNPHEVATAFINHFEAGGWMIKGGVKMTSWKHALSNWVARGQKYETHRINRSGTKSDKNDAALRELYNR
jgi:uncharacterized protein YdaU (DUF1376 family)